MELPTTLLVFLLSVCLMCGHVDSKGGKKMEKTEFFDVKPSGTVTHQNVQLENGVMCVFTHAAVGGTNEEWSMTLRRTGKNTYVCTIERPEEVSYLYFMSFAASVLEYNVQKVEIFENSGALLLQDEEFVVTDGGKSVKHKDGGFRSNLVKIILTAKKSIV